MGISHLWIRCKRAQKSYKQSLGIVQVDPYILSASPPECLDGLQEIPDHEGNEIIICITPISSSPSSPLLSSSSEESLITQSSTDEQPESHQDCIEQKPLRPLPVAPRVPVQPVRKVRALPTPPSTPPPTQSLSEDLTPRLEIATKMLHALAYADSPVLLSTGLPTPIRDSRLMPSDPDEFSTTAPIDWDLLEEALGCR